VESSHLVQQKFTFRGVTLGTRYLRSSFQQFPISSSLHVLSCFSVSYAVLRSCLYKLSIPTPGGWRILIYTVSHVVAELAF